MYTILQSMFHRFLHKHIREQLSTVHIAAFTSMAFFFCLLYALSTIAPIDTYLARVIISLMTLLIAVSYGSLKKRDDEPRDTLVILFILNICTSLLIWTTGLFRSPFIMLYLILIVITSQHYTKRLAIWQITCSFVGFTTLLYAVNTGLLSTYPFPLHLFQPYIVILVHACIYGVLFAFALISSANARRFLLRFPHPHVMGHQETIVANMPLAVLVVDSALTILSHNNKAAEIFSPSLGKKISTYFNRPESYLHHLVKRLAEHGTKEKITWHFETGKKRKITISASFLPASNTRDNTFMIFVEEV